MIYFVGFLIDFKMAFLTDKAQKDFRGLTVKNSLFFLSCEQ